MFVLHPKLPQSRRPCLALRTSLGSARELIRNNPHAALFVCRALADSPT